SSSVETITSRTVRGGFAFLILSRESIEGLEVPLAALDPERHCLRDLREIGQTVAPASAPTTADRPPVTAPSPLIRVRSETIDALMTEIGEMRGTLARLDESLSRGRLGKLVPGLRRFANHFDEATALRYRNDIDGIAEELGALHDLQTGIIRAHRRIWQAGLELRVVPLETLFVRLARTIRDLARKLGKEVELVLAGGDVRLDKSMVDQLTDPLMHMIRNALDHGIETPERRRSQGKPPRARLSLTAADQGDGIRITIEDDGQGLNRDRIRSKAVERGQVSAAAANVMSDRDIHALIFAAGFSTADAVTDVSGRGVGLDVVATAVRRLGGNCEVETTSGKGTRFTLKLPMSASLMTALIFKAGGETLALPERQIVTLTEVEKAAGGAHPLHELAALLGFTGARQDEREPSYAIIVAAGSRTLALAVDQLLYFQDLFLKELPPLLAALPAIGGASLLGDGRPVLVLDAEKLERLAGQRPL
ncbi:MAG TPA: ATP-binding protein, partial [Stellaceae bacterium]|nr:ATP-binding protein [Stellaceae bacterium]